jgi:UDP-glucose 4-epimerase
MKCLIIGGGGFLGSHLAEALLADGHSVRIFDRPNLRRFRQFEAGDPVEWVEGDFLDQEQTDFALADCDAVYHLVSTTLPRSSNDNPAYDIQTNVIGTLHLLEAARRRQVTRFVFVSSGGTVYGTPQVVPISESHPTEPICSYGIGKLAIEKYLHLHSLLHDLDYCVLRLANPYGERQRVGASQGAVAVFLDQALRNEEIQIWGDGSVVRDYFYVGDAAAALTAALTYRGEHRIFNIGSGVGASLNDIVTAIESLIGNPVRRAYLPGRAFDVPVSVLDISRAKQHLKWTPKVSLSEGLTRTASWLNGDH